MSVTTNCPGCGQRFTVTDELLGRVVACPHCAKHVTVPTASAQAAAVQTPVRQLQSSRLIRFTFTCMRCASILEATSDLSQKQGRCPTCGAVFIIPEVDTRLGTAVGPAVVADDGQLPTPMHAYATAGQKAPKIIRTATGDQVIVCPRCNCNMPVDANTCAACGMPFTMEGSAEIASATLGSNSQASLSLTFGIISLLLFCLCIGPLPIVLGILGHKKARRYKDSSAEKMAIAGIIMGTISTGLSIYVYFF